MKHQQNCVKGIYDSMIVGLRRDHYVSISKYIHDKEWD